MLHSFEQARKARVPENELTKEFVRARGWGTIRATVGNGTKRTAANDTHGASISARTLIGTQASHIA